MWWEAHLICPGIDVSGFAIPGLPGIVIGHNQHVAWGITTVMIDDVDFYIEELNHQNQKQYRYQDHWEDFKSIIEIINIKGEPSQKIEILLSRNGPVVDSLKGDKKSQVITARWAYNDFSTPAVSAYQLSKAHHINDVIAALHHWEVPGQNIIFADTEGNIGFWCCGAIPIRSRGDGLLPAPGWTGQYKWQGYVPFSQRPHDINPENGFIATANHDITRPAYPHFITTYWAPELRIQRIHQMLAEDRPFTMEEMKRMQLDVLNPWAEEIVPEMVRTLRQPSFGEQGRQAADILSNWDRKMTADSAAASIFELTCLHMFENLWSNDLGDQLYQEYLDLSIFAFKALRKVFQQGYSEFFEDEHSPQQVGLTPIITVSLQQTLKSLIEKWGPHPEKWQWGHLHQLNFGHVLGERKPLDKIFNLGPYPVAGSQLTVNRFEYQYTSPFKVVHGVSQRMLVDLNHMAGSLHVLPTGESGLLSSPHYRDQWPLYQAGQYHPAWTQKEDLMRHAQARLILNPP
jgi:penicillin amidase